MAFYTGSYRDQNMMSGYGYSNTQVAIHNRSQAIRSRIGEMNIPASTQDRYLNMVGKATSKMLQAIRKATGGGQIRNLIYHKAVA